MDPILFTDRKTGPHDRLATSDTRSSGWHARTTDGCSLSAYTDNDGDSWVVDQAVVCQVALITSRLAGEPFTNHCQLS